MILAVELKGIKRGLERVEATEINEGIAVKHVWKCVKKISKA